jgi:hypothetical protein
MTDDGHTEARFAVRSLPAPRRSFEAGARRETALVRVGLVLRAALRLVGRGVVIWGWLQVDPYGYVRHQRATVTPVQGGAQPARLHSAERAGSARHEPHRWATRRHEGDSAGEAQARERLYPLR